jgi:hypothetical protein
MKYTSILALAACALAAGAAHASGTTWLVTGPGEPATIGSQNCTGTSCPTLRDAINSAGSGDTIAFASALDGATIRLSLASDDVGTPSLEFGHSAFLIAGTTLTIDGGGHGITIARDTAQPAFRLFDVAPSGSLTLIGLTLRDGAAIGGSSNGGGGALGAGGAIFNQGNLTILACSFLDNRALGGSGGLFGSGQGGGGGVGQDATTNDGGGPNGGAAGAPPGNGGFGGGGGATLDTVSPGGNGGFGGGGGRGASGLGGGNGGFGGGGGGDAFLSGNGGFGGGHAGGDTDHVPTGGGGAGMGGAIFNDAGTATIVNATFRANSATGGNATYAGSPAAGGNGSGLGGAIFNYAGTLNLSFVTFAANATATGTGGDGGVADGGAVYSYGDKNCGAGGNTCANGTAHLVMVNSIAAQSMGAPHDVVVDVSAGGSLSSGNGNLLMAQSGFQGGFVTADPRLGSLHTAQGAPATLPIGATSPAKDAAANCLDAFANPVTTDARGIARPQFGACDIGAYEYDGDYIFANGFD